MIRILWFDQTSQMRTDLTPDDLPAILAQQDGILWVDFVETPSSVARPLLEDVFGFHPLAVDDALEEAHVPKVDDWGDYLYLVFYAMTADFSGETAVDLLEVDCFLMPRCFVTYQVRAAKVIDRVWANVQSDPRYASRGASYLLYQLLDTMMTNYMLTLEEFDDRVELAEDRIFERPTEALLGSIFAYKRGLLHLRRSLAPQREVLNRLSRGDFATIAQTDRIYFRDIYDHLVRLYDITDTMRDVVNGTLDMYLSVVNNRMNDVMKTLTVITTLFMPLSFLVGFFGMNFFQASVPLPAWTGPLAFTLTLGAMVGLPLVMYWWMHRRELI